MGPEYVEYKSKNVHVRIFKDAGEETRRGKMDITDYDSIIEPSSLRSVFFKPNIAMDYDHM